MNYTTNEQLHFTKQRAILCGNIIECFQYERPIISGLCKLKKAISFFSEKRHKENRKKSSLRAKRTLIQIINTNAHILRKFLTLTFKDNVTNIAFAYYELKKFVQRLEHTYSIKMQYACVIEFQDRGAIHFHILCNLPYIDVNAISRIWGNGFIKLNRIDNVDNVGAYVTKYMTKDGNDERLCGQKSYTLSRGLKKPCIVKKTEEVDYILSSLDNVKRVFFSEYDSEYYGHVKHIQIILESPFHYKPKWQRIEEEELKTIEELFYKPSFEQLSFFPLLC